MTEPGTELRSRLRRLWHIAARVLLGSRRPAPEPTAGRRDESILATRARYWEAVREGQREAAARSAGRAPTSAAGERPAKGSTT